MPDFLNRSAIWNARVAVDEMVDMQIRSASSSRFHAGGSMSSMKTFAL
jgi:hypothetical protein